MKSCKNKGKFKDRSEKSDYEMLKPRFNVPLSPAELLAMQEIFPARFVLPSRSAGKTATSFQASRPTDI